MFEKLASNSKHLLDDILQSENPTKMLTERLNNLPYKENAELQAIIRELRKKGYIDVLWADNIPWRVTINNSARTYAERLAEYESEKRQRQAIVDNGIHIGNGNSIANSTIASHVRKTKTPSKKAFIDRHPYVTSLLISLLGGLILMFSFWEKIVAFIEEIF